MFVGLLQSLRVAAVVALLVTTVEAAPRGVRLSKRASVVNNTKRSMTNAERLARGLSPNPPRFGSPTRVRRSGPSGVPQPPVMSVASCPADGFIKVTNPDGYFNNAPGASGAPVGLVTDTADAGIYRIDPCSSEPFAITCTNCATQTFQYLDAVVGPYGGDNFGPFSMAYGYFAFGPKTAPGALPQYVPSGPSPGGNEPCEASIWSYDDATNALNATWVNQDGGHAQLYALWQPESSYFTISGRPSNVTLSFVPV